MTKTDWATMGDAKLIATNEHGYNFHVLRRYEAPSAEGPIDCLEITPCVLISDAGDGVCGVPIASLNDWTFRLDTKD